MARKRTGMGERHKKIMEFLVDFQEENGYPPTIRQIGENIGVSSTSWSIITCASSRRWAISPVTTIPHAASACSRR